MHKKLCQIIPTFLLLASCFLLLASQASAQAANSPFTEAVLRLDNMRANQTDIRILVIVKPASVATEDHFRIVFGHTMGVDTTAANITTSVDNLPPTIQGEAITAWVTPGGATTGVAGAAQTYSTAPCSYNSSLTCFAVDFTSGELTAGTLYGFFITAGIDTPAAAGQQQHVLMSWDDSDADNTYDFPLHEEIDMSNVATRIITDDQVIITAVVPPNLTFSLNHNKTTYVDDPDNDVIYDDPSGTGPNPIDIDPTGYVTSQRIIAGVGTNALNGWSLWLKSANQALVSARTGESIPTQGTIDGSPTTMVAGSDYYQLDTRVLTDSGTANTGLVSIPPEYHDSSLADVTDTAVAKIGGTFMADYQEIGYADGKTDGDEISIYSHATTNTMRAAATDYTDTWEVIACGNF